MNDPQPYPAYQNTDIPWLGQVPAHWEILPNRALFREISEKNHPDEPMLSVTIRNGVIKQKELLEDSSKKDGSRSDKSGYKLVRPGDFAYNKMRAWQGAIGASKLQGIISPAYIVQRLRSSDIPQYFHYLFRTPMFAKEAERWSYGITSDMWSLRSEHFKLIYSPRPPKDEQDAIARYLDWADGRIRRLIRARQKQIKLLEEHKQVIIQQAVTGQVDVNTGKPYPAYKDSGVEWLGHVPENWIVAKLGRFINLLTGFPFKSEGFSTDSDDLRLLRGINVAPGKLRWDDVVYWSRDEKDNFADYLLKLGDVILGMDRPIIKGGIRVAEITEIDTPSLLLQRVCRITARKNLNQKYLLMLLQSRLFLDYLSPIFTGISVPHISPKQIQDFSIPLPSLDEQKVILEWIAKKTDELDTAIEYSNEQIKLIQEYRTRLIADVVTGKVDVRQAAGKLPALEEALEEAWDEDEVEDEENFEEADDAEQDE